MTGTIGDAPADERAQMAQLIDAARRYDTRALAAIHDRFYAGVYRYLLYRLRDEHLAEDLASEVFMRLLDALQRGKGPDTLPGWLFGVADHLATDHFRRAARRPQSELHEGLASAEADTETAAGASLARQAVREALSKLTPEQQQVLALRFDDGLSVADTAACMHKSVTAVKQMQFRAVAALRRLLDGAQ